MGAVTSWVEKPARHSNAVPDLVVEKVLPRVNKVDPMPTGRKTPVLTAGKSSMALAGYSPSRGAIIPGGLARRH